MTFEASLRDIAIPGVVGLIMLVVGLSLTIGDFRRVARFPKTVVAATLGQLILLPLLAFLLIRQFQPPEYIVAGMILLAASPAGGLSNFYTWLGRGNTALSVTLTAISNLLCFITLPLIAATGFAWLLDYDEAVQLPFWKTAGQLFVMLFLPLFVGMLIRYRWPAVETRWKPFLGKLSLAALAALVMMILYVHRNNLEGDYVSLVRVAIPFYLLAMLAGWGTAKAAGLDDGDRFALLLEYPARNLGITAVIGVMVLGRTDFVLFATVLFLIQTPVLLGAVAIRRKMIGRNPDAARPDSRTLPPGTT
ncbi:MAG: bile acid:sodium symporter family protein [Pirellulaceae bacterium]